MKRFANRVAILSGATQGIGLATAKRLGQEGCKVVVNSRRQNNVDDAVRLLRNDGIEASGISGNQRIKEDRQKLIEYTCEKYGGFDCLFMNAGVSPHVGNLLTVSEEEFDRSFETNVKSNFQFIQEVAPMFEKRGGGSIVAHSTVIAYGALQYLTGNHLLLYAVSKLCLIGMVQHVASDCFKKGIRVNCVAPGPIDTAFLHGGIDHSKVRTYSEAVGLDFGKDTRLGHPEEIAATVAYLLSDDSSYVTGNCIIASGGLTLHRSL